MLIICYLYSSLLSVFSLLLPSLFRLNSYIFGWDGNKCNVVFLNERMAIILRESNVGLYKTIIYNLIKLNIRMEIHVNRIKKKT